MKASEVLSRYANGERNFRNADLRGQSFKGQDLSGADFSGADIRSSNFSNAALRGTNFTGTKAGLQKRCIVLQLVLSVLLSAFLNFVTAILNTFFVYIFLQDSFVKAYSYISGICLILAITVIFSTIVCRGLTIKALMTSAVTGVITVAITSAGAGAGAIVGTGAGAVAGTSAVIVVVVIAVVGAVAGVVVGAIAGASTIVVTIAGIVAVVGALLSGYVAWRTLKGDEKFAFVRTTGVAFGALGGTSFCGADLTGANFAAARLKSANFNHSRKQQTVLDRICWKDSQKLDRARVGDSLLANANVRELLVSRNGYKKSYIRANLRDADLTGVNLNCANLQWADLSGAILQRADLREANLRETLALGTDFRNAYFTAACLEAWNIDSTTKLDEIDCQHVYLLRDQQERRPSSGDFAPGEFTKLFEEVLSTVDLIFRDGIDWKAFVSAFQQVQVQNEDTELAIQSIENKGDGVVVVRVSVPPETDKSQIHGQFNQNYEAALKALEAKYHAELKAKDSEITIYREHSANMWTTINSLASRPINVVTENTLMNNSSDQSQNVNVGRDMNLSGSTLNLGEINGSVTNSINQLASNPEAAQLADLLKQLQTAIAAEPQLSDDDKALALEQTGKLAEAAKSPADETSKKPAKLAVGFLKGMAATLPDTANLVEACAKLLPLITSLIGL